MMDPGEGGRSEAGSGDRGHISVPAVSVTTGDNVPEWSVVPAGDV